MARIWSCPQGRTRNSHPLLLPLGMLVVPGSLTPHRDIDFVQFMPSNPHCKPFMAAGLSLLWVKCRKSSSAQRKEPPGEFFLWDPSVSSFQVMFWVDLLPANVPISVSWLPLALPAWSWLSLVHPQLSQGTVSLQSWLGLQLLLEYEKENTKNCNPRAREHM